MQRQDLEETKGKWCRIHLTGRDTVEMSVYMGTGQRCVPPSKETLLSPVGNIASNSSTSDALQYKRTLW